MKNFRWLFVLVIIIAIYSCEDFIQDDISNRYVILNAPVDSLQTSSLTISFWWEEVKAAETYTLQICKPNFTATQALLLDTQLTGNSYSFTFPGPGTYSWRVKAVNNISESQFTTNSLVIDSTINLSGQTVLLNSPADNFSTTQSSVTFRWSSLYNADNYRFQLIESSSSLTLLDTLMASTQLLLQLDTGTFKWRVRAENDVSVSVYSERTISYDTTGPAVSVQQSPANTDTVSSPVTLTWNRLGASYDSIYIYADTAMSVIRVADIANTNSFQFTGSSFTKYYWRLKSFDIAGNGSGYSPLWSFYVQ